jgi:predicted nucleic acid-binding protein
VRRVVIDASAFIGWFGMDGPGRALRDEYERGSLTVITPRVFALTVLEMAARRSGWGPDRLRRLAVQVDRVGFELHDPPPSELAAWLARGLTGHDAAHAALASALDLRLVTADSDLLRTAAPVAITPADA